MSAVQRAEQDIRAGNLGLARQRLESYMQTKGYDPVILGQIGRICLEMKDKFNAGRHWMLSTTEGADVEEAVDYFVGCCGKNPDQAVSLFLKKARLSSYTLYPPLVQERLKRHRLELHVARIHEIQHRRQTGLGPARWGDRLVVLCLLSIVLLGMTSCVVGFRAIIEWTFS